MTRKPGKLFALFLPLLLLIPVTPSLSVRIFQWREPTYQIPLATHQPLTIRQDPYGSGLFGARRSGGRKHQGVDWAAPLGTSVLAAKSGLARIGTLRNGMGRYVRVEHPDGSVTLYGHLREIGIRDRQRVRRGQPLGTVGKSGNARRKLIRSHLHFEVWNESGVPVDPLKVME